MSITKRSSNDRNMLLSKTAYTLPKNPSAKGYTEAQIIAKLYEPIMIVYDWLVQNEEEMIAETKGLESAINSLKTLVGSGSLPNGYTTLIGSVASLYNNKVNKSGDTITYLSVNNVDESNEKSVVNIEKLNKAVATINEVLSTKVNTSDFNTELDKLTIRDDELESAIEKERTRAITSEKTLNEKFKSANDKHLNDYQTLLAKVNSIFEGSTVDLDSFKEIVDMVNNAGSDILNVLAGKVNISDIIDTLDSVDDTKPLSARKGKELKDLIDELRESLSTKASIESVRALDNNKLDKSTFSSYESATNLILESRASVDDLNSLDSELKGLINERASVESVTNVETSVENVTNNVDQISMQLADLREKLNGYVFKDYVYTFNNTIQIPSKVSNNGVYMNTLDKAKLAFISCEGSTTRCENLVNWSGVSFNNDTAYGLTLAIDSNGTFRLKGVYNNTTTNKYVNFSFKPSSPVPMRGLRLTLINYKETKGNLSRGIALSHAGVWGTPYTKTTATFTPKSNIISIIGFNAPEADQLVNGQEYDISFQIMVTNSDVAPTLYQPYFEGLKPTIFTKLRVNDNSILPYNVELNGLNTIRDTLELREKENGLFDLVKVIKTKEVVINCETADLGINGCIRFAQIYIGDDRNSGYKKESVLNNFTYYAYVSYRLGAYYLHDVRLALGNLDSNNQPVYQTAEEFRTWLLSQLPENDKNLYLRYSIPESAYTEQIIASDLTLDQVTLNYNIGDYLYIDNPNETYNNLPNTKVQLVVKGVNEL